MNFILKEGQTTRNQRHKLGPAKESTTRSHWFPNVPRIVVTPSAVPVRLRGGDVSKCTPKRLQLMIPLENPRF